MKMYIVICRDDHHEGQPYVAATHTVFASEGDAKKYAQGIAAQREPRIVGPSEYLRECMGWKVEGFAVKIIADKAAVDAMVASIKRVGEVAEAVGRAAESVTKAAEGISTAPRRGTSSWAAVSWADLLGRFTGR